MVGLTDTGCCLGYQHPRLSASRGSRPLRFGDHTGGDAGGALGRRIPVTSSGHRRRHYRPSRLLPDPDPATGEPVNFATVTRDLREAKRVEEQLRQSQKMEAIGQLTGGVAHDFNNLLMAVVGNLDLLRRHVPENPKLQRFIDGAMQGAQRGAALTQRLLAFARRQDLQPQSVDVVELVQGMTELLTRSIGPMIELRLEACRRRCRRPRSIRTSWNLPCSTSPSMDGMPCPTAAH